MNMSRSFSTGRFFNLKTEKGVWKFKKDASLRIKVDVSKNHRLCGDDIYLRFLEGLKTEKFSVLRISAKDTTMKNITSEMASLHMAPMWKASVIIVQLPLKTNMALISHDNVSARHVLFLVHGLFSLSSVEATAQEELTGTRNWLQYRNITRRNNSIGVRRCWCETD